MASALFCLGTLNPGEASCHGVKTLKQHSGKGHELRNSGLQSMGSKTLTPTPKSHLRAGMWIPGSHQASRRLQLWQPLENPEQKPPRQTAPEIMAHRNYKIINVKFAVIFHAAMNNTNALPFFFHGSSRAIIL